MPDRDALTGPVRQRKIIHIDMDAFFASVEQRDNPQLRGKPVAVGGSHERGVVAAACYEARKFGVRLAMPSVTAKRRCPDLIFVKPRFDIYMAVSLQIREIFAEYTPIIEPLALDEAYLDVTLNLKGIASATKIVEGIRTKIRLVTPARLLLDDALAGHHCAQSGGDFARPGEDAFVNGQRSHFENPGNAPSGYAKYSSLTTRIYIFIYFWCFTKSRSRVLIHVIYHTGGTLGGEEYGVSRPCLDHRRSGEFGFRHAREGALSSGTSLFSLETHLCWEENGDRPQDLSLSASCRCAGRRGRYRPPPAPPGACHHFGAFNSTAARPARGDGQGIRSGTK